VRAIGVPNSPKKKPHNRLHLESGQGALTGALPFFFVSNFTTQRIAAHAVIGFPVTNASFFLLPLLKWKGHACCARPCFACAFRYRIIPIARSEKSIALRLKFRFILGMIGADTTDSKLCADIRTTLRSGGFQPPAFAQLGKGGTPVASPSAASGEWKLCRFPRLQARAAPPRLHHWAVRP
jgi:hypothetical protein